MLTRDAILTGIARLECVLELLSHNIPQEMLDTPDGDDIEALISNQILEWRDNHRKMIE